MITDEDFAPIYEQVQSEGDVSNDHSLNTDDCGDINGVYFEMAENNLNKVLFRRLIWTVQSGTEQ